MHAILFQENSMAIAIHWVIQVIVTAMVYFRPHVARILRVGVIQQAHRQNKAGLRVQVSWGQTRLSEVPLGC